MKRFSIIVVPEGYTIYSYKHSFIAEDRPDHNRIGFMYERNSSGKIDNEYGVYRFDFPNGIRAFGIMNESNKVFVSPYDFISWIKDLESVGTRHQFYNSKLSPIPVSNDSYYYSWTVIGKHCIVSSSVFDYYSKNEFKNVEEASIRLTEIFNILRFYKLNAEESENK